MKKKTSFSIDSEVNAYLKEKREENSLFFEWGERARLGSASAFLDELLFRIQLGRRYRDKNYASIPDYSSYSTASRTKKVRSFSIEPENLAFLRKKGNQSRYVNSLLRYCMLNEAKARRNRARNCVAYSFDDFENRFNQTKGYF